MLHVMQLKPLPCYKLCTYVLLTSSLGKVTKGNTAQRKSDGKGQSLRFKLKLRHNITVTESLCTEHFCSHLPSQHPDDSFSI